MRHTKTEHHLFDLLFCRTRPSLANAAVIGLFYKVSRRSNASRSLFRLSLPLLIVIWNTFAFGIGGNNRKGGSSPSCRGRKLLPLAPLAVCSNVPSVKNNFNRLFSSCLLPLWILTNFIMHAALQLPNRDPSLLLLHLWVVVQNSVPQPGQVVDAQLVLFP